MRRVALWEALPSWLTRRRFASPAPRPHSSLIPLLASAALAGCGINNIPTYEQSAKAAWSEVLNQYKRRADLIPNLVESVKGFADQERTVLTDVVEARAKATQVQANIPPDILTNPEAMKKFQDAQSQLGGALRQLLAVVERYPDIKSGQNFLALQSQIEGTENRIAIARRDYIRRCAPTIPRSRPSPAAWWKCVHVSVGQGDGDVRHRRRGDEDAEGRFRHAEVARSPRGTARMPASASLRRLRRVPRALACARCWRRAARFCAGALRAIAEPTFPELTGPHRRRGRPA